MFPGEIPELTAERESRQDLPPDGASGQPGGRGAAEHEEPGKSLALVLRTHGASEDTAARTRLSPFGLHSRERPHGLHLPEGWLR